MPDDTSRDDRLHRLASYASRTARDLDEGMMGAQFVDQALAHVAAVAADTRDPSLSTLALLARDGEKGEGLSESLRAIAEGARTLYTSHVVYEGLPRQQMDDEVREHYHLPGEKVRVDPEARIQGIDQAQVAERLGTDPLTVRSLVVTGFEETDFLDQKRQLARIEYEFDGVDGRHNAKSFMPEAGLSSVYGVMVEKDDRLWVVPLDEREDGWSANAAREVTGFSGRGRDQIHPDGFDAFKAEFASDPQVGPFSYSGRSPDDASGPVRIVVAQWRAGASDVEVDLARTAIKKAEARERDMHEAVRSVSKGPPPVATAMPQAREAGLGR